MKLNKYFNGIFLSACICVLCGFLVSFISVSWPKQIGIFLVSVGLSTLFTSSAKINTDRQTDGWTYGPKGSYHFVDQEAKQT